MMDGVLDGISEWPIRLISWYLAKPVPKPKVFSQDWQIWYCMHIQFSAALHDMFITPVGH